MQIVFQKMCAIRNL